MKHFRRRIKILSVFVILIMGGSLVFYFATGSKATSPEFVEARLRGALVAERIVSLAAEARSSLQAVNELDAKGKYAEALELTTKLEASNQSLRDKAIQLSREVETMTRAIEGIHNDQAQKEAIASISSRLAMVSRLVNYSSYYAELLDSLRAKFVGLDSGGRRPVKTLIEQINSEINAINNFDQEARRTIERFDEIVKNNSYQ